MINKDDITIETFPPTPPGLRHNGSIPGIQIIHKSGIGATCTKHRSQHKNKEDCIALLKLYLKL
jgi:protein subunit release factor A